MPRGTRLTYVSPGGSPTLHVMVYRAALAGIAIATSTKTARSVRISFTPRWRCYFRRPVAWVVLDREPWMIEHPRGVRIRWCGARRRARGGRRRLDHAVQVGDHHGCRSHAHLPDLYLLPV